MIDDFSSSKNKKPATKPTSITVHDAPLVPGDPKTDTDFQPPEVVAAQSANKPEASEVDNRPVVDPRTKNKPTLRERITSLTKRQKILIVVIALLIIAGGSGTVFALVHHKKTPAPIIKAQIKTISPTPPAPTTVPSNLTGLPVDAAVNSRPVTGVMIENSTDARPQSGLNQAGIVFEAVAEGGITRFLALFQDTQPDYLGPVRSARPYYLQWCLSFDCALAHVGGSPEALSDIPTWGVKDLDQFANGSFYQRISSRIAPHNVYTSMAQLNQLEGNKGFGAGKFTSWPRKPDAPAKTLTASVIDFKPSSSDFDVHYQYSSAQNLYIRNEGGPSAHTELNKDGSVVPITPKVVIAMIMNEGLEADDHHTSYASLGSGAARIFQDGTEVDCTWHKADNTSPITFTDANNQPIKLNAGQTWVTVLGSTDELSFVH